MTATPVQHKRPPFLTVSDRLMLVYAGCNVAAAGLLLASHNVSAGLALWLGVVWLLVAATAILSRFTGELIGNRIAERRLRRFEAAMQAWHRELHSV